MTYKYIKENGVRRYNPAWHSDSSTLPFLNRPTALPVVSYPSQPDMFAPEDDEIVVTPSYQQALDDYRKLTTSASGAEEDDEIVVEGTAASPQHHGLGALADVLAKYEVPCGVLSKLLALKEFDVAEFIIDDSGSMTLLTDAKGPDGEGITRWQEAKLRVLRMLELMAYVPLAPKVEIRFLNRSSVHELERGGGESAQVFYERIAATLDEAFRSGPGGSTPALACIEGSLARHDGRAVLRYFFGDGVPDGGTRATEEIARRLKHRPDPARNPFTFLSCTNDDRNTEWMKETEEVAPFCSEFDDYMDESCEIIKDQGEAFPYSYGLHLIGQLVAAFNPNDLDALDESVPLSKRTLEGLLGYQMSDAEYKYYFDGFLEAQRKLALKPYQQNFVAKLPGLYSSFVSASLAADIPAVGEYRRQMKAAAGSAHDQRSMGQTAQSQAQSPQNECCNIL